MARDATPDAGRVAAPDAAHGSTPDAGPPAAPELGFFALLISQLLGLLNSAYGPRACCCYALGARGRSWAQWDLDLRLSIRSARACLGPVLGQMPRCVATTITKELYGQAVARFGRWAVCALVFV